MLIVGIDPGKTGGVCLLSPGIRPLLLPLGNLWDNLEVLRIVRASKAMGDAQVYIEKAQVMGKEGGRSSFTYGEGFGFLQGVVMAFELPFTLVPPAVWTKDMLLGTKTEGKDRNVEAARRLFPGETFLATSRSTKPHLGLVDAVLIAEWGRRRHMKDVG